MADDMRRRLQAVVAVHEPAGVEEECRRLSADELLQQAVGLPLARVGGKPTVGHRCRSSSGLRHAAAVSGTCSCAGGSANGGPVVADDAARNAPWPDRQPNNRLIRTSQGHPRHDCAALTFSASTTTDEMPAKRVLPPRFC